MSNAHNYSTIKNYDRNIGEQDIKDEHGNDNSDYSGLDFEGAHYVLESKTLL